jgi:hypothetical protein
MPLFDKTPPDTAWAVTVYFTPAAKRPGDRRSQARRLTGLLLRLAGRARGILSVHQAQIESPGGMVETMYPEAVGVASKDPCDA